MPMIDDMSALNQLLSSAILTEFIENYWPTRLFVQDGSTAHQLFATDLNQVMDIKTLVPFNVQSVRVHRMAEDGYRPIILTSAEFGKMDLSAPWSLERAQIYCPSVNSLLHDLAERLWVPLDRISASIFVSPGPNGLPWHFDPVEVLIVPLIGKKIWFLKENVAVHFPFHKYVPSQQSKPHPDLAAQCQRTLTAPDLYDGIWEGKPGSVCFLPRGWWHKTEAETHSVSLSIGINTPRLMDVVLGRMERLLGATERWREPVSQSALERAGLSEALADIAAAVEKATSES
jgi:50S ribosomal protein L16 3-hydroxylase